MVTGTGTSAAGVTPARQRHLQGILQNLGGAELGRAFGLQKIRTLADFRAAIPLMNLETHAREVEARVGFGATDSKDPRALELSGCAVERPGVVEAWRSWLGERPASGDRALLLQARNPDPLIDRVRTHDLEALGAEVRRIESLAGERALEQLHALLEEFEPTLLCAPSSYTVAWLERTLHGPLDRRIPSLRLVLAGHDHRQRVRARVPVEFAGWIDRSGRLGLPSPRAPARAFALAAGSVLLELLPHTKFDRDGRPIPQTETVLPEHSIIGERYEVVVSSPLGFLRMRIDEHVRVVGFDPPTVDAPFPRPRVVRLPPPPIDIALEGVSLLGTWMTASVRRAFRPEDPALVAATIGPDLTTIATGGSQRTRASDRRAARRAPGDPFVDTELGGVSGADERATPRPRRLLVQVEVQGDARAGLEGHLIKSVDKDLCRRSPAYAHLRGRGELMPPSVVAVDPGTYHAARIRRIRSLRGRVGAPVVRVVDHARAPIFPATTIGHVRG